MSTELNAEGGMHIDSDPKTGAIAVSQINEDVQKVIDKQENKPEEKQEQTESEQKTQVDPRKAAMDVIYGKRQEQFKKELEYAAAISNGATVEPIIESETAGQDRQTGNENIPQDAPEQVQVKEEIKQEPKVEQKTEPEKPTKRTITLGNQTYELTEAEIEQLAQRAIYNQQQVQQTQQQPQYQNQAIQQPQHKEPARDELKEIARKITYGSEEESTNALEKLVGLSANMVKSQQVVTPEQIAFVAKEQAKAEIRFETNLDTIAREYGDIYESRAKSIVAADKVGSLRQKYQVLGVQKPDLDIWREACKATRDEFQPVSQTASIVDEKKKPAQQITPSISSTRVERKRAAPQPPAAVNKTMQLQENSRSPTGSDVVNAMRKARGQAAIN